MSDPIVIQINPGTPVEIIAEPEYQFIGKRSTVCLLVMPNGYEVVGTASCVREEDFDPEFGKKIAYENALQKAQQIAAYLARTAYVESKDA